MAALIIQLLVDSWQHSPIIMLLHIFWCCWNILVQNAPQSFPYKIQWCEIKRTRGPSSWFTIISQTTKVYSIKYTGCTTALCEGQPSSWYYIHIPFLNGMPSKKLVGCLMKMWCIFHHLDSL
jgi:hypothetical protein